MTRKIGIYNGKYHGFDEHCIDVKLKNNITLKKGDIVTDDMIKDYKDPLWEYLVYTICINRDKNNGELADIILDLIRKERLK